MSFCFISRASLPSACSINTSLDHRCICDTSSLAPPPPDLGLRSPLPCRPWLLDLHQPQPAPSSLFTSPLWLRVCDNRSTFYCPSLTHRVRSPCPHRLCLRVKRLSRKSEVIEALSALRPTPGCTLPCTHVPAQRLCLADRHIKFPYYTGPV